jgi:hypothetical protein
MLRLSGTSMISIRFKFDFTTDARENLTAKTGKGWFKAGKRQVFALTEKRDVLIL